MSQPPIVLLTGASAGIGRVTAELLARSGYRVFGTSRNPAKAPQIPGVELLALDLDSAASVTACVETVLARAGRIDVLINNAGAIGPGSASEEVDVQSARALFETNFFGVIQMTNAVLPIMRRQGSGTIVNLSSTGGLVSTPPFFSMYAASKHALEGYTEGLRYEVRPFGIQVVLIEPGYTFTTIGDTIQPPDHPLPEYAGMRGQVTRLNRTALLYGSPPEEVAQTILCVLGKRRPALRYLTGSDSQGLILARRALPPALFERLIEWMYLSWKPATSEQPGQPGAILTPRELGLRRFLFHSPTRNRALQTILAAGLVALGAAIGSLLIRGRRSS